VLKGVGITALAFCYVEVVFTISTKRLQSVQIFPLKFSYKVTVKF